MALDLFAVVAPGQARCRRPDARGLRDLAQLGMRVAMKIGGTPDEVRADMEAFGGPVVHVTAPLVVFPTEGDIIRNDLPLRVDHALVQRLVRELISHAAGRRPAVIYCKTGVVQTGLVASALQLAMGRPWPEVLEERRAYERLVHRFAFPGHELLNPSFAYEAEFVAQERYLEELARVSRPAAV